MAGPQNGIDPLGQADAEWLTVVNPKVNIISVEPLMEEDKWTILGIVENGTHLASAYLQSLQSPARTKILALLKVTAQNGPVSNPQKFGKLGGPLYEFKSYQDRLPFFYDGQQRIVVTHGFQKKTNKARPEEIARARRLMDEYLESKGKQEARER